jgi:hypothetical protein
MELRVKVFKEWFLLRAWINGDFFKVVFKVDMGSR